MAAFSDPTEIPGPAAPQWTLMIVQGPNTGQRFTLGVRSRIGRDASNEIALDDSQSSRFHAVIQVTPAGCQLIDQNSTNGVRVNGLPIAQPTLVRSGDRIGIGNSELILEDARGGSEQTRVPQAPAPIQGSQTPPEYSAPPAPPVYALPHAQPAQPPPVYAPPPAASLSQRGRAARPKREKRGCLANCLIILFVLVCLVLGLAGGGYLLYQNGTISRRTVLNMIGMGTGELSIVNTTDDSLSADLIRLDTESGEPQAVNDEELETLDVSGFGGIEPGSYKLTITIPSGIPSGGDCLFEMVSGDVYQFVVVPQGIAVTRRGFEAQSAADLDFQTTALCAHQGP
jgi:pSer/pThr/pTyr-binding forkhead associated (FHA) protein